MQKTTTETPLFKESGEIWGTPQRYCECCLVTGGKPCYKSLDGYSSRRRYHPECEDRVDRARRAQRAAERREERRAELDAICDQEIIERPEVYRHIKLVANDLWMGGYQKFTMRLIFEVIRCHYNIRVSNSLTRPYTDRLLRDQPHLKKHFGRE